MRRFVGLAIGGCFGAVIAILLINGLSVTNVGVSLLIGAVCGVICAPLGFALAD